MIPGGHGIDSVTWFTFLQHLQLRMLGYSFLIAITTKSCLWARILRAGEHAVSVPIPVFFAISPPPSLPRGLQRFGRVPPILDLTQKRKLDMLYFIVMLAISGINESQLR